MAEDTQRSYTYAGREGLYEHMADETGLLMNTRYTKRPVVIEAVQWRGDFSEISAFMEGSEDVIFLNEDNTLDLPTLEGTNKANLEDWIIKGVKGEFYPCKPDIFDLTYDPTP